MENYQWFDAWKWQSRSGRPVFTGQGTFAGSMSRYIPFSNNMDSEDQYHSPYDTNELDSEERYISPYFSHLYPSSRLTMRPQVVLKETPQEASSFPPVPDWITHVFLVYVLNLTFFSPGEKTLPLESRLRYNAYSPHHTIRQVNITNIKVFVYFLWETVYKDKI